MMIDLVQFKEERCVPRQVEVIEVMYDKAFTSINSYRVTKHFLM